MPKITSYEEALEVLRSWALRASRQLKTEVEAHLDPGYTAALDGNTLKVTRTTRVGGFLGFGGRTVTETVLEITIEGGEVTIATGPFRLDKSFLLELANALNKRD